MSLPLSDSEYVERRGMVCPHCTSGDITAYGDVEVDDTSLTRSVACNDCGERWDDVYTLTGWQES